MRAACLILLFATLLSTMWWLLLVPVIPMGPADALYGSYRAELSEVVGYERANEFTREAYRIVKRGVADALTLGLGPLLLVNAAWAVFGLRRLVLRGRIKQSERSEADEAR